MRGTRSLIAAAALLCAASLASCSFDTLTGNVKLTLTNIPSDADRIDVLVTDSAQATYESHTTIGTGQFEGQALVLTYQIAATGTVKAEISAISHTSSSTVGTGEAIGNYNGTDTLEFSSSLTSTDLDGTFGHACFSTGTPCIGTDLVCKKYSGTDIGICTLACPPACPTSPTGSTCEAFPGAGSNFCQWECGQSDGGTGTCPTGLTCGAAISGKRYCQGSN